MMRTYLQTQSGAPGQSVELVTTQGPTLQCLLGTAIPTGTWRPEDFGAVALPFSAPHPDPAAAQVTLNTAAINAAFAAAHAGGGGTVLFGPGVYYTNGPVGFDITVDTNESIIIKGVGPFPASLLFSLQTDWPALMLHSRVPNLRMIYVEDMEIVGGRQNLSLELCFYCRFNRIFFWGALQFALQCHNSDFNEFHQCYFNELTAGGGVGDAVLLLQAGAEFVGCTFGEGGGGIINRGFLQITGGHIFQSWYKGSDGTDYWTTPGTPTNISWAGSPWFALKPTIVCTAELGCVLDGVRIAARYLALFTEYSHRIVWTGGQCTSESVTPGDGHFLGFVYCYNYVGDTALCMQGTQFQLLSNGVVGDTGYFIYEPSNLLHDSLISSQVVIPPGATLLQPSVTSPQLLNPGTENNSFTLKQFHSTSI